MLQLTQTDNGQISGVLSYVELKQDGRVSSEQAAVDGTADAGQLTLKFPNVLSFILGKSIAGTIEENTIRLQIMDSSGNVSSEKFERSSSSQFKAYVDDMKSKGQKIAYSMKLLSLAQQYRETAADAERWITNAQAHAQRIPVAKADYEKIEGEMRSLVGREHQTLDPVTRSQISVAVAQADVAGKQVDIRVQAIWDADIGESGSKLDKEFAGWDGNCGTDRQLRSQGAGEQALEAWDKACKQVVAERPKFEPIYRRVSEQRADLKSFQVTARAHRKALVDEANRIQ